MLIYVAVSIVGERLFFAAGTYTYDGGNANAFGMHTVPSPRPLRLIPFGTNR